jgi:hypothetical protein
MTRMKNKHLKTAWHLLLLIAQLSIILVLITIIPETLAQLDRMRAFIYLVQLVVFVVWTIHSGRQFIRHMKSSQSSSC